MESYKKYRLHVYKDKIMLMDENGLIFFATIDNSVGETVDKCIDAINRLHKKYKKELNNE